jgi:hypothetical protein
MKKICAAGSCKRLLTLYNRAKRKSNSSKLSGIVTRSYYLLFQAFDALRRLMTRSGANLWHLCKMSAEELLI